MNGKVEVGLIHLAPILASLLFGVLCASLIRTSQIEFYAVTPFPEGIFGSLFNAFYFVILVGFGASLLYILLKRKDHKLINLITGFALTVATFMLSIVYLSAAFLMFPIPYADALVLVASLLITALAVLAIFKNSNKIGNLIVLCLGGALGAFLGFSIPILSIVLILGFLSIYDVFAVYRGPVGKIARSGLEQLRGLSFSFKDVQMGLGDLTFYSMLSGCMLINFSVISCSAAIMGILLGCLLSFKMLEKKGMFPGLPFPVFFGLAASLLASLIQF